MRLEVLNSGTELLLGSVVNTHLRLIAEGIFPLGLRVERQTTVPDGPAIRDALRETFGRADIVVVTGGLGPTTDDITRDVTAELLGLELIHDEAIMQAITDRLVRRGFAVSGRTHFQAQRPREAVVLANRHGTAPGLYLAPRTVDGGVSPHLFLLPGPPRELEPMFEDAVLPILKTLLPPGPVADMRVYRIAGLGESMVEEMVGEPLLALGLELGYCARPGEVDVRMIGDPGTLDRGQQIISEKLGPHIVSLDQRALEKVVVDQLTTRGETLAIAESCTGGCLANRITNVPGASAVFVQGFVTYANQAKTAALGVDPELIRERGAVSHEVARAMADGARRTAGADHALATTGIAGPGGGTEEKPVGTVYIALATKLGSDIIEKHRFPTDRETFKNLVSQMALDLLRRRLGA
jgi:nicotinamide-nucleotide amidase